MLSNLSALPTNVLMPCLEPSSGPVVWLGFSSFRFRVVDRERLRIQVHEGPGGSLIT